MVFGAGRPRFWPQIRQDLGVLHQAISLFGVVCFPLDVREGLSLFMPTKRKERCKFQKLRECPAVPQCGCRGEFGKWNPERMSPLVWVSAKSSQLHCLPWLGGVCCFSPRGPQSAAFPSCRSLSSKAPVRDPVPQLLPGSGGRGTRPKQTRVPFRVAGVNSMTGLQSTSPIMN